MAGFAAQHRVADGKLRRRVAVFFCALAAVSLAGQAPVDDAAPDSHPDEVAAPDKISAPPVGRLIRVPLPITDNVDNRAKGMVQRAQGRMDRRGDARPVLVLELAPGQSEFGVGSDFTRALALARFLTSPELAKVKTVAYIPRSIKGHAVLVAMACEEIVMNPEAELGEAGLDEPQDKPIEPAVRSGYEQIANRRRTIPVDVALGMLDKNLEVLKVDTEVSVEYVLREELEALRERSAVTKVDVLIRPGELGHFSGRQGRELGFVKYLAPDRQAVERALGLEPGALQEDPSLGGDWDPVRVHLDGTISAAIVGRLQNMIDDQLRAGEVNFICLRIDSPGGSLPDSMVLANYLAGLDGAAVRTVAYIPSEARSDAALVAMACDHVVMHPDAILGGAGAHGIAEDQIEPARKSIRESLAVRKSRSWSLVAALVDPTLNVYRYEHNRSGVVGYFGEQELAEQDNPDQWSQGEEVTRQDEALEVDGQEAKRLGLAWDVVENFEGLKQLYGLQRDPRLVEPSWADMLIQALARPELAVLLLVIGGVGLYAELQAPGIGVGGFVASVCFLLFFWSKFLNGTAGWLEVILFLAGLCFLLMEIFVLPGFGIFGLGGGLLVIASLVLASQTFVFPQNESELDVLRDSFLVVGAAAAGIIAVGVLLRRYLHRAPVFNRMLLEPPQLDAAARESLVDFQHLLGHTGVATTQLTPSGKARFGDELLDVIAEGEVIDRGTAIVVVEVHGNRVVVQTVDRQ